MPPEYNDDIFESLAVNAAVILSFFCAGFKSDARILFTYSLYSSQIEFERFSMASLSSLSRVSIDIPHDFSCAFNPFSPYLDWTILPIASFDILSMTSDTF